MGYQILYYPPPPGIPAQGLAGQGGGRGEFPLNTSAPTISGTAQVGQLLTATTGAWANAPNIFTYQWYSAGIIIASAVSNTYVPVSSDIGNAITVVVAAQNSTGIGSPATSVGTSPIVDIVPTINTAASIPGIPQVGIPITPIDAIWNHSVTSRAYQWQSGGVNATGPGAALQTYTPVAGDVGNTLTVTVTTTNSGGTSSPSTSAASAAVIGSGVGGALDFSQSVDSPQLTVIVA